MQNLTVGFTDKKALLKNVLTNCKVQKFNKICTHALSAINIIKIICQTTLSIFVQCGEENPKQIDIFSAGANPSCVGLEAGYNVDRRHVQTGTLQQSKI